VIQLVPGTARNTRQRTEVLALLEGVDGFRSAQQLHAELRERGAKVGLTTVYRTLHRLVEAGEVDQLRLSGGEQLYRRCGQHRHHHHLVCRDCGKTVEVAGADVERWAARQAAEHDFTEVDHTLEIIGTCPRCRQRQDTR
jgi:Fur family ferric uptake transcriptional regulator